MDFLGFSSKPCTGNPCTSILIVSWSAGQCPLELHRSGQRLGPWALFSYISHTTASRFVSLELPGVSLFNDYVPETQFKCSFGDSQIPRDQLLLETDSPDGLPQLAEWQGLQGIGDIGLKLLAGAENERHSSEARCQRSLYLRLKPSDVLRLYSTQNWVQHGLGGCSDRQTLLLINDTNSSIRCILL